MISYSASSTCSLFISNLCSDNGRSQQRHRHTCISWHISKNAIKRCCFHTISHLQSGGQLWVPPSVTQRCSMWWLASRPPTLLPASPAVFSITMRSCGVVNLPTMTLLSPSPSVLSASLSLHFLIPSRLHLLPHRHTQQTIFNFSPAVTSHSLHFIRSIGNLFLFSPQPRVRLHLAAHSPSSLEPWLSLASSPSFTRASKYPLAATVTPEEESAF